MAPSPRHEVCAMRAVRVDRDDVRTVRAVQRLWYDVSVHERGADLPGTDHVRRLVDEPITRQGHLFAAWSGARLVGALVSLYAGRDDLGDYPDWIGGCDAPHCSLTIRLATARSHRDGAAAVALARATYRQGLADGIEHDFADTHRRALPFFHRLGYRRLGTPRAHPFFGATYPLRLDLRDRPLLLQRRSPFVLDLEQATTAHSA